MSLSNQPPETGKKNQTVNNLAVYSVGAQVGCATLAIVIVALFAGIGLDTLLHTKPFFIIVFILGSAPLSLYLTYQLAMRAVKNVAPKNPVSPESKPVEEEGKRE